MSISQPKLQNPCKKFIEFKGDAGVFQYWDKNAPNPESKKPGANIEMPLPIGFIVLDELSTIKGFNESSRSGVYANEVHSVKNQTLHVRTFKGGTSISGKYAEIKDKVKAIGGKYCKSIYAALILKDKSLELVNFQLTGAAFKAWIDKTTDANSEVMVVSKTIEAKKGKVVYQIPVWGAAGMTDELRAEAIEMDKKVQEYLKARKVEEVDEVVQDHPEDDGSHVDPEQEF